MKRTVQMAKGNVTNPRNKGRGIDTVTMVGQNPRREWTPGPVIDFNKSYNKRVAAQRALQAEMDAKQAGMRAEDGVTA